MNIKSVIPALDPAHDAISCFSYDGLEMYITSGSGHANDLRVLRRGSNDESWGPPENLGPTVNSPSPDLDDSTPSISSDGLTLYFHSNRTGGYGSWDIYMAKRVTKNAPWGPPVNLGPKVNSSVLDSCPSISPDGLELYFNSLRPGGYGSADIYVTKRATQNEPWEEGVNLGPVVNSRQDDVDCIVATFALDPAKGPFSVFAWVKGGAPGQVVISEPGFANWLMADAAGKLMTELKGPGRYDEPLLSQTIITDGQWHRIGLVWDGSRRMLYVDGVVAAEDTQSALPSTGCGLYIGTGKAMEPGTFWSGLIDDVRIYNRAVRP